MILLRELGDCSFGFMLKMSVSVEDPQQDRRGGLLVILAATAFAGATGYLLQVLVPAWLGNAEAYLQFTVFWSTTFLVV